MTKAGLAQNLSGHHTPSQDQRLQPDFAELLEARRSDALARPEAAVAWVDVKRRLLALPETNHPEPP